MIRLLHNTRRHDLTIYRNGRIDITSRTARLLALRVGDVIDVAVDDESQAWLYVKHRAEDLIGRHEAQCYAANCGRGRSLRAHSRRLAVALLHATGQLERARLAVGEPARHPALGTALPIITHNTL